MPDTYTKKQIAALRKKYAYLIDAVEKYGTRQRALAAGNPVTGEGGPDLSEEEIDVALLLFALSTAEKERERLQNDLADRDTLRVLYAEMAQQLGETQSERDALKAQVAELEARLEGAADRAGEWLYDDTVGCSEESLRSAIVGKKED